MQRGYKIHEKNINIIPCTLDYLAIFQLGVYLSEEHGEAAHIFLRGLHATNDLVLLSRTPFQQTRAECGLLRWRHRVVHRTQTRSIITEVRLTY